MGNNTSALHRAADANDYATLCHEIQTRNSSRINDQEDQIIACVKGYDAIARELLRRGANADILDKDGRAALHHACAGGHVECVKALLAHRARRDIRDKDGKLPYDLINQRTHNGIAVAALVGVPASAAPAPPPRPQHATAGTTTTAAAAAASAAPGAVHQPQQGPGPLPPYPQVPGMLGAAAAAPGQQPNVYRPAGGPQQQQQQQQQQRRPSNDSGSKFPAIAPEPPTWAAPTAPPAAPAAAVPIATQNYPWPAPGAQMPQPPGPRPVPPPQQQQQQQQLQLASTWPGPASGQQAHAAGGTVGHGGDDDEDDEWGTAVEADWGGEPAAPEEQQPRHGPLHLLGSLMSAPQKALEQLARLNAHMQQMQQQQQQQVGNHGTAAAAGVAPAQQSHGTFSAPAGRLYTYQELYSCTGGFSEANKMGSGGYGPVYRGSLDGLPVAVKVLDDSVGAMQGTQEFLSEVNLLYRLHHPHIVMLIGSCPERGIIVYELMDRGSLDQHLFQRGAANSVSLPWQARVRTATELASALLFLHSNSEPIVHMDIKPANVLLNASGVAKLGDVGLARLLQVQPGGSQAPDTSLVGTLGYLDPEYMRTGQVSDKCDLFALGVVMLQMLTGREDRSVTSTVLQARQEPLRFQAVMDPRAGPWPVAEAVAFADVALKCVAERRQDRPDLRAEVLPSLLQLRQRTQLYPAASSNAPDVTFQAAAPHVQRPGGAASQGSQSAAADEPPAIFFCPITQDIMEDPVFAADGYTYERLAIEEWIKKSPTSPLTNMALSHTSLVPNHTLRSAIREWVQQAGARRGV